MGNVFMGSKFDVCLTVILILIFLPVFAYCCGWLGGWILSQLVGSVLTNGFNVLFNTTRFVPELIPVVCGALAVIGNFFKITMTTSKK